MIMNDSINDNIRTAVAGRRKYGWIALSVVVLWLATGFYTVDSNQRGVVTRFGKIWRRTTPGIHYTLPRPIDRVYTPATTEVRRIEVGFRLKGVLWAEKRRSDMLTGDQNILKVMMVVQYKIRDPEQYLFRVSEPDWLVERAIESSMSAFISRVSVDDVLTTGKAEIEIRTVEDAQAVLDQYGVGVTLLTGNLQVVSPPVPVIEAFNDVARAKKDSERSIEDARVYSNEVIPRSEGEAEGITNAAGGAYEMRVNQAYGSAKRFNDLLVEYNRDRKLTKQRLYLETMERVLSKTKVVIVDDSSTVTIIEE